MDKSSFEATCNPSVFTIAFGILTLILLDAGQPALQAQSRPTIENRQPKKIEPALKDVKYGPHPSNVLDVYKTPLKPGETAPAVVYIHGGGFSGGDKTRFNPGAFRNCRAHVISINYRLSGVASFPAPMHDSVRAIQFVRHKAKEWQIDPSRIAATGGSAGAGISAWIAFHDEMANPESEDPVERESSRLLCIAMMAGQTSYDRRFILKNIGPKAGNHGYGPRFWGLDRSELDTPKAYTIYEACSPLTYLTRDDPPVFTFYGEPKETAGSKDDIHSAFFGIDLKKRMDKLGIHCELVLRGEQKYAAQFFNKYFYPEKRE